MLEKDGNKELITSVACGDLDWFQTFPMLWEKTSDLRWAEVMLVGTSCFRRAAVGFFSLLQFRQWKTETEMKNQ